MTTEDKQKQDLPTDPLRPSDKDPKADCFHEFPANGRRTFR
jgi:hypothetical protein